MSLSPVVERFLKYVKINTRSVPAKTDKEREERGKPSCEGQKELKQEILTEIGTPSGDKFLVLGHETPEGATLTSFADGSFLVFLPATEGCEDIPHVVYAAHMDTYYDFSGDVTPHIHTHTGGDLVVNEELGVVIPASDLEGVKEGDLVITSDGTSVLGSDDKAGVAAMVEVILDLVKAKHAHGPLSFWFCTDEEIGELDINVLPEEMVKSWDILWTIDSERLDSVDIGCFFVRWIRMTFKGTDAHPGVAGHKLKPAHLAASVFTANMTELMPTPMETSGMEGTVYISEINGGPSEASLMCKVLSFEQGESDYMAKYAIQAANLAAGKFGTTVEVDDQMLCKNPRVAIAERMDLVKIGIDALTCVLGHEPEQVEVRGGTDGAMVNMVYPNLPTPNFPTGGKNLHGPQEFLVVEELEMLVITLTAMIIAYVKMNE